MSRRVGKVVAAAAFLTFLWVPACVFDLSDVVPLPDGGAAATSTGSSSGSGAGQGGADAAAADAAPTSATAPTSTATTSPSSTTTSPTPGSDASTAPPPMPLCGACEYTHDCQAGAICLSYNPDASIGGFCGQDCTNTYCPGGYGCIDVQVGTTTYRQCAPKSGSCK